MEIYALWVLTFRPLLSSNPLDCQFWQCYDFESACSEYLLRLGSSILDRIFSVRFIAMSCRFVMSLGKKHVKFARILSFILVWGELWLCAVSKQLEFWKYVTFLYAVSYDALNCLWTWKFSHIGCRVWRAHPGGSPQCDPLWHCSKLMPSFPHTLQISAFPCFPSRYWFWLFSINDFTLSSRSSRSPEKKSSYYSCSFCFYSQTFTPWYFWVKSLSSLNFPKALLTFSWKSFHFKYSFSSILPIIFSNPLN